jgi:hypothetical protein
MSCARSRATSFASGRLTCVFAVAELTNSSSPISWFDMPRAMRRGTSTSRSVKRSKSFLGL